MKRNWMLLVLFGLAFFSAQKVLAFTSVQPSTFIAAAQSVNAGTIYISYEIRNLSDNSPATSIYWSTNSITLGSTIWRRSDAYIILHSTITTASGAIEIYTDNKAADANPQYSGTGDPVGLVDDSSTTLTLPMCWRITDVSTNTLTIVDNAGYLDSAELPAGFHCFLFMRDKNSSGINLGDSYLTVKEAFQGMHYADSVPSWSYSMTTPNYIYIGANFTNAKSGRKYKTSTLRIEAFNE